MKTKNKFCKFCNKTITINNFTTHKKSKKHIKNKENYKEPDELELNTIDKNKFLNLSLDNIIKLVDNIKLSINEKNI